MYRIMAVFSVLALLLVAACERQEQRPIEQQQRETQTAPAQPGQPPAQEPGQAPTQPGQQPGQEPGQAPTQPGQTPGGQQ